MSKIIQFISKHNKYCVTTVICDDNKVDEEIANHKEYDYVINEWYGNKV